MTGSSGLSGTSEAGKERDRHIVALGGGGFSMEPDNPLLDKYILGLTTKANPNICFIPTASGDSQDYIDRFYHSFRGFDCKPHHLSLFRGHTAEIETFLLGMDVIYVGGGNTRNLLTLWKDWGVDQIIRKAWESGIILSGISAGSICWFQQGITDSIPGSLSSLDCLGFLSGSNCPHYDGEAERRPAFHRLLKEGSFLAGLAADDGVGLHFVNQSLHRIVSSHPDKKAFRMSFEEGEARETPLKADYLGGDDLLIRRAALQDTKAIHEAHMQSIQEVCAPDYTPAEISAWGGRPYLHERRLDAIQNDFVWVAEDHGKIAGFCQMKLGYRENRAEAHIQGLYLTLPMLKKKLGHRMLLLMTEMAEEQKMEVMTLNSTITALSFYKKHGFVEMGGQITREINGMPVRCYPLTKKLLD